MLTFCVSWYLLTILDRASPGDGAFCQQAALSMASCPVLFAKEWLPKALPFPSGQLSSSLKSASHFVLGGNSGGLLLLAAKLEQLVFAKMDFPFLTIILQYTQYSSSVHARKWHTQGHLQQVQHIQVCAVCACVVVGDCARHLRRSKHQPNEAANLETRHIFSEAKKKKNTYTNAIPSSYDS